MRSSFKGCDLVSIIKAILFPLGVCGFLVMGSVLALCAMFAGVEQ